MDDLGSAACQVTRRSPPPAEAEEAQRSPCPSPDAATVAEVYRFKAALEDAVGFLPSAAAAEILQLYERMMAESAAGLGAEGDDDACSQAFCEQVSRGFEGFFGGKYCMYGWVRRAAWQQRGDSCILSHGIRTEVHNY